MRGQVIVITQVPCHSSRSTGNELQCRWSKDADTSCRGQAESRSSLSKSNLVHRQTGPGEDPQLHRRKRWHDTIPCRPGVRWFPDCVWWPLQLSFTRIPPFKFIPIPIFIRETMTITPNSHFMCSYAVSLTSHYILISQKILITLQQSIATLESMTW